MRTLMWGLCISLAVIFGMLAGLFRSYAQAAIVMTVVPFAIAAALVWGFANADERLPRWSRAQLEQLIESTNLEQQMRDFGVWEGWVDGSRGRQP